MSRYLLDSHAVLWSVMESPRLSERARDIIASAETDVFVSAANYYELMFKARRGRLPQSVLRLPAAVGRGNYRALPVSDAHLQAAALLDWGHGDPWDRILIAQANFEDLALISIDDVFDAISERRVW